MREVFLKVLTVTALGILSLFGPLIPMLGFTWQLGIIASVVTLLTIKVVMLNTGTKKLMNNASLSFEVSVNLLIYAYVISGEHATVAAYFAVGGWVALLAFLVFTFILWVTKQQKDV